MKYKKSVSFIRQGVLLCLFILFLSSAFSGCGYNTLVQLDEGVNQAWSQVENQYQRRADLIPNLVNTVQGAADFEKSVLTEVTEMRSKVGQMKISADDLSDPEKFEAYQKAQDQLSGALSRLLVVAENYPQIKSNENFKTLQDQLEGTENRITVARKRFIDSVKDYNVTIRKFPANLTAKIFGYDVKPSFTVENEKEISKPPEVKFE